MSNPQYSRRSDEFRLTRRKIPPSYKFEDTLPTFQVDRIDSLAAGRVGLEKDEYGGMECSSHPAESSTVVSG